MISTSDIVKLRALTNAGLMDCKNALIEANGDIEKAIEIIRKRGKAIALKRADKLTKEGRVIASTSADKKFGFIIAVGCETDFVAKNNEFINLTNIISNLILENKPDSLEAIKNLTYNNIPVSELINEKIAIIGEKIDIVAYYFLNAEYVQNYVHFDNKIGVIVGFNKEPSDEQVTKNIAMQIAAMNPISIDENDVPQDILQKELEIAKEQALQENKPQHLIESIAQGKLKKFLAEATLLNQQFIINNKITVKQYLQNSDKDLKITKFYRCAISD